MSRRQRTLPLPKVGHYNLCRRPGGVSEAPAGGFEHRTAVYVCRAAPVSRQASWSGELLLSWEDIPESAKSSVSLRCGVRDTLSGELYLTGQLDVLSCGDIVEPVSVTNSTRWEVESLQRCNWEVHENDYFCRRKCACCRLGACALGQLLISASPFAGLW
jgi:hypothetical protein